MIYCPSCREYVTEINSVFKQGAYETKQTICPKCNLTIIYSESDKIKEKDFKKLIEEMPNNQV
jgi:hypothetical protein